MRWVRWVRAGGNVGGALNHEWTRMDTNEVGEGAGMNVEGVL